MSHRVKDTLAAEITVTLCVKALFLWLLWFAFFSNPLDEHLTTESVGQAFFGAQVDNAQVRKEVEQ